jgi:tetratricopeptide (TPR) repeat protein
MKRLLLFSFSFACFQSYGQPNCSIYKSNNDLPCYEACLLAMEAERDQGSGVAQRQLDNAIQLCPTLDYAYVEKSVAYLKTGNFVEWKRLIDKAVEINPLGRLGYRGWCRYQFVRDYKGAIIDFERLDSITQFDIGYSQNGDYHLNIAKALCYKGIGQAKRAIEIIEKQLAEKGYAPLPYDYLHLGVLKMESGDLEEGIMYLKKSISINDYLAEPYYYLGLIYKKQNSAGECRENMEKARSFYLKGHKRFDPYTHPMDKVYLSEIETELKKTN